MADTLVPPALLEKAARKFKMLSEPVRLQLLNHLNTNGETNVQDLVAATGQHQANVSKHLRVLSDAGLVARRKEGLYAYYSISDPILSALCMLVCGQLQQEALKTSDLN